RRNSITRPRPEPLELDIEMMNTTHCYHHTAIGQIRVWLSKVIGLLSFLFLTLIAAAIITIPLRNGQVNIAAGCLSFILFFGGIIYGVAIFNQYPEICLDDQGLSISFMFQRIKIPWSHVIHIGTRRFPYRRTFVTARRIMVDPIVKTV
ncbi:MAG: hypothetical protein C4291_15200, partial [Candidatus Dadabacteria bacterium]